MQQIIVKRDLGEGKWRGRGINWWLRKLPPRLTPANRTWPFLPLLGHLQLTPSQSWLLAYELLQILARPSLEPLAVPFGGSRAIQPTPLEDLTLGTMFFKLWRSPFPLGQPTLATTWTQASRLFLTPRHLGSSVFFFSLETSLLRFSAQVCCQSQIDALLTFQMALKCQVVCTSL